MALKVKEHLPIYGVGPIYVGIIVIITVISIILTRKNDISLSFGFFNIPFIILGFAIILFGLYLWIRAVIVDKVDDSIKNNKLHTTGVYSLVRNPIYSAVLMICTGLLIINGNIYLFILPVVYWLFLTILMITTEEKWLRNMFSSDYENYCKKVNRCIPIKRRGRK